MIPVGLIDEALAAVPAGELQLPAWLRQAGLPPDALSRADGRLSAAQAAALWRVAARHLDDEFLRLDSRPMRCGSYRLMALASLSAPSLERALRRAVGFLALVLDDTRGELRREGARAVIVIDGATPLAAHASYLLMLQQLFTWLARRPLPVLALRFAQPAPAQTAAYRQTFGRTTAFGGGQTRLELPAAQLTQPPGRDERELDRWAAGWAGADRRGGERGEVVRIGG